MRMSPNISDKLLSKIPKSGVLLDIGCGEGSFLRKLSGKGLTLIGVDPRYKDSCPEIKDDIRILYGTGEAIPCPSDYADCIVLQCVFSLCEPEKTVRETYRVLKKGGTLLVSDLYSEAGSCRALESPLADRIDSREQIEGWFRKWFRQVGFYDETDALLVMLGQAVMNGKSNACIAPADLQRLKKVRARYGLWVWRKDP